MPEELLDAPKRDPLHDEPRGVRVPERVEVDGVREPGVLLEPPRYVTLVDVRVLPRPGRGRPEHVRVVTAGPLYVEALEDLKGIASHGDRSLVPALRPEARRRLDGHEPGLEVDSRPP